MTTKNKFIAITFVVSVLALLLTRVIWPDAEGSVGPTGAVLFGFAIVNIFEALGFGVGVAFLITQWNTMKAHPWTFASLVYLMASWWPHDNMHRVGENAGFVYLLKLEIFFHVALIIAGFILANFVIKTLQTRE